MNYYIISAAFAITLLITLIFSVFSRRRFNGLWLFFLLIFLSTWSGQFWIPSFGPTTNGIAWIPLIAVALFFSLFVLALIPTPTNTGKEDENNDGPLIVVGAFFWIILILLIFSIIAGYYKSVYMMPA